MYNKTQRKMVMLENKNQHQLCLMKEFFQGRLPLSFGLHPQKCVLNDKRERRNSRSFALDLPSGLKDLFSAYLPLCVDIIIHYY